MRKLTLRLPTEEKLHTGRQVTFEAPCNSEELGGLIVDGVTYAIVDSNGRTLVDKSFSSGAMVSVIFNLEKKKAFVQNADTNAYLEGKFDKQLPQPSNTAKVGQVIVVSVATPKGEVLRTETVDPSGMFLHVGSDNPPATASVWIDPNGEPTNTEDWEFDLKDGTTEVRTVVVLN